MEEELIEEYSPSDLYEVAKDKYVWSLVIKPQLDHVSTVWCDENWGVFGDITLIPWKLKIIVFLDTLTTDFTSSILYFAKTILVQLWVHVSFHSHYKDLPSMMRPILAAKEYSWCMNVLNISNQTNSIHFTCFVFNKHV